MPHRHGYPSRTCPLFHIRPQPDPSTFLPTPQELDKDKTEKNAQSYVEDIFKNWNEIHLIIRSHEETIRKRWTKKTVVQRQQLLISAYGKDMPKYHRPDFVAHAKERIYGNMEKGITKFRDS
jgi:hypothetical protein